MQRRSLRSWQPGSKTRQNSSSWNRGPTKFGDKLHLSYLFSGVEEGEPYVVEHHLSCAVSDGKIDRADLLCSGFRPRHPQ